MSPGAGPRDSARARLQHELQVDQAELLASFLDVHAPLPALGGEDNRAASLDLSSTHDEDVLHAVFEDNSPQKASSSSSSHQHDHDHHDHHDDDHDEYAQSYAQAQERMHNQTYSSPPNQHSHTDDSHVDSTHDAAPHQGYLLDSGSSESDSEFHIIDQKNSPNSRSAHRNNDHNNDHADTSIESVVDAERTFVPSRELSRTPASSSRSLMDMARAQDPYFESHDDSDIDIDNVDDDQHLRTRHSFHDDQPTTAQLSPLSTAAAQQPPADHAYQGTPSSEQELPNQTQFFVPTPTTGGVLHEDRAPLGEDNGASAGRPDQDPKASKASSRSHRSRHHGSSHGGGGRTTRRSSGRRHHGKRRRRNSYGSVYSLDGYSADDPRYSDEPDHDDDLYDMDGPYSADYAGYDEGYTSPRSSRRSHASRSSRHASHRHRSSRHHSHHRRSDHHSHHRRNDHHHKSRRSGRSRRSHRHNQQQQQQQQQPLMMPFMIPPGYFPQPGAPGAPTAPTAPTHAHAPTHAPPSSQMPQRQQQQQQRMPPPQQARHPRGGDDDNLPFRFIQPDELQTLRRGPPPSQPPPPSNNNNQGPPPPPPSSNQAPRSQQGGDVVPLAQYERMRAAMEERMEAMGRELEERGNAVDRIRQSAGAEIERLNGIIQSMEGELESAGDSSELVGKLNELSTKFRAQSEELAALKSTESALKEKASSASSANDGMQRQLTTYKEKVEELQDLVTRREVEKEDALFRFKEAEEKRKRLEQQCRLLATNTDTSTSSAKRMREDMNRMMTERDAAVVDRDTARDGISALKAQINSMGSQMNHMADQLAAAEQAAASYRVALEDASSSGSLTASLQSRVDELMAENRSLKATLARQPSGGGGGGGGASLGHPSGHPPSRSLPASGPPPSAMMTTRMGPQGGGPRTPPRPSNGGEWRPQVGAVSPPRPPSTRGSSPVRPDHGSAAFGWSEPDSGSRWQTSSMASFSPPRSRPVTSAGPRYNTTHLGGGGDASGVRKPFRDVDHVGSLLVDPPVSEMQQPPMRQQRQQGRQQHQHPPATAPNGYGGGGGGGVGGGVGGGRLKRREQGPPPPQRTEPYATAQSLETRMKQTAQLENQLMQFNLERNSLESRLARIPSHPKTQREREEKGQIESRLGYIDKSISKIRFVLRDMHVLE